VKRAVGLGLSIALAASFVGSAAVAQDDEKVTILSTQFEPVAEREAMNNVILADVPVPTEYLTVPTTGVFFDQIETGTPGDIDAIGALHGEFATLAKQERLMDLSDLAAELSDVVSPALMEVGKLGTDTQYYIPWMQATYIMAANKDALQYLPDGADINALTWDQWRDWGKNIFDATGERRLGLPLQGGPGNGLPHRLLQGYL
jgi:multiple sugar transport system substrate-binding protein